MTYVGRFAPTPSGDLHMGSLLTAVASYLDARHQGGQWFIRVEDTDLSRCKPGTEIAILDCLSEFGLLSDQTPIIQSQRTQIYEKHFLEAVERFPKGTFYPCYCTRKTLAQYNGQYPGTCRKQTLPSSHQLISELQQKKPYAIRWRMPDVSLGFEDRCAGTQVQHPSLRFGDPIIVRKEGFFAYHWAVVIDDWLQGVSHVVRGRDLLEQTGIHCLLQQALSIPEPTYAHIPLIVNSRGKKLSKSERAASISGEPVGVLLEILRYLNQPLPDSFLVRSGSSPIELLSAMTQYWSIKDIPSSSKLFLGEPN